MGGYDSYSLINNLEETVLTGGTQYTLNFEVFDENGSALSLNAATIVWTLAYLGDPSECILQKDGTVTGTNTFKVVLESDDTIDLNGKFISQPVITDFNGDSFRPGQGIILINPAIPVTNINAMMLLA